MTKPFTFVRETISHDTAEAFENLAARARSGEITGGAATFTTRDKGFGTVATGLLYESKTFAVGTVVILLYRMVMRAVGRDK
ncbi:hypothetical protein SAMN05216420_101366 [Nitrosospira sp. Nl5]|uniref:hypothetical protein n=1 Tax=Nitrosospira sp. Nl5 TaxID=200120 RepID=UPI00087FF0BB|nr:hypothetical protein [Nitrosospira sp. Nl5]SCX93048.1 hypothetical protein SAMN05216420_101366 [Nitrosospira sp. Nl5]